MLLALIIDVCGMALWAFHYWWKKNHHTREKFAFLGAGALIGLITLFLVQLGTNTSFLAIIAGAAAKFWGIPYNAATALSNTQTAVYMLVLFGFGLWFYKMFTGWDGQKSIAQHEQEQNR